MAAEVDEAVRFTDESPFPDPSVAFEDLYTDTLAGAQR